MLTGSLLEKFHPFSVNTWLHVVEGIYLYISTDTNTVYSCCVFNQRDRRDQYDEVSLALGDTARPLD